MATRMRAGGGRCRGGNVPNCNRAMLVFRPDPRNPPETEEELQNATMSINAILEGLNPPPGDPERDTLVFIARPDMEDEFEVLGLAWVIWRPDERDLTEHEQS